MTGEPRDLYQELILEHCRRPRNFRVLPEADYTARGDNPLCGDQLDVYVKLEQGVIRDITFSGVSCAVATASASLMTEALLGGDTSKAQRLSEDFQRMVTEAGNSSHCGLGELVVFGKVREFPSRVQCATLAWHALDAVLRESHGDAVCFSSAIKRSPIAGDQEFVR